MLDFSNNNHWLIIIGLVFIMLELLIGIATGFDLFVLGIIFIIAGGIGIFTGSFQIALVSIFIFSLLYIILGRKMIKNKLSIATKATNTDAILGQQGVVIKTIQVDQPGQIKVNGEVWRAQAKNMIESGKTAVIRSVSGVTVFVE